MHIGNAGFRPWGCFFPRGDRRVSRPSVARAGLFSTCAAVIVIMIVIVWPGRLMWKFALHVSTLDLKARLLPCEKKPPPIAPRVHA